MTTVHATPQERIAFSKGAPEVILNACTSLYDGEGEKLLSEEDRERVYHTAEELASQALRVIGLSYKKLNGDASLPLETVEQEMVFAGLVGMIDPPRDEVRDSIRICESAGIKPIMITGDHKITATAIAKEIGILREGEESVSGTELDKMDDETLDRRVEKISVYARVSPSHKLRIVDAFKKKERIVAMTGDGVNDAPALKSADIGVAMGINGTDVSREASDMILTDDNFASIVSAVEEGRTIFSNIRKYLVYLLTGNMGAVFAMVVSLLVGFPLPLSAVQILFINLLMDGAPAVALSVEPPESGIMQRPPRPPRENIFNRHALYFIPLMGLWITLCTLGLYLYNLETDSLPKAMTEFFATLISMRLINALNCRSASISLFKIGFFTNKWLLIALASSFLLMLAGIYIPFLQVALGTVPLGITDWMMVIAAVVSLLAVDEITKLIRGWRAKKTSNIPLKAGSHL
jgi:Ca2+-transporting ATPase